jgi:hypothetical protein
MSVKMNKDFQVQHKVVDDTLIQKKIQSLRYSAGSPVSRKILYSPQQHFAGSPDNHKTHHPGI